MRVLYRAGQQEVLRDGGPQQVDGSGEAAVARKLGGSSRLSASHCLSESVLSDIDPPVWAGSGRVPAVPQEEQRGGSEGGGEAPSVPGRQALWPRPVPHIPHD